MDKKTHENIHEKKSMKKSKKNTEFVMKNISLLFRIFLDFSGEIIFDYC